jgi:tetratricopeptide (TPR) repeat protein
MRSQIALTTLAFSLAASRAAMAQPEPSASGLKMAQDLVEEGRVLGQQGKWSDALERFRKAASVSPKTTPQLAFYVGYAEERVGKLVAADVDLRRAIELAHAAGNEQVAKAARAELPDLEARTPALTIVVNGTAAPVSLTIDGGALGVAALGSPVPLDPGDHTIVVRFAAGPVSKEVSLVEHQRATVTIDPLQGLATSPLESPTSPPLPPPPTTGTTPPTPEASGGNGRKVLSLVVMGAGGAALVTGGVFYLLARSAISPVTSACPSSPCVAPSGSPLPSDYRDAQSKQTIAVALASAGGVVAATGLVLLVTGGSNAPSASAASNVQLAPWLGPGGGGASLGGSF